MKRFFCTECKKVRRVRNVPRDVNVIGDGKPHQRLGVCRWHNNQRVSRASLMNRVRVITTVPKAKKAS
jgi:hypothetical protein